MALDGTYDHMIVREACEFFRRLDVREPNNREATVVRHEFNAGRLEWTYEDVKSLIQPYPKREYANVLECIGLRVIVLTKAFLLKKFKPQYWIA